MKRYMQHANQHTNQNSMQQVQNANPHSMQQVQQPIYYISTMPPSGFNFPSFPPPNFIPQQQQQQQLAKRHTEDFLNNLQTKKARIEIINGEDIKQRFKGFNKLENTPEDFNKLMDYISNDMDLAISIIEKKDHMFIPFERHVGESIQLASNIKLYAIELQNKKLRFCKYNEECKCRETCSFIHEKIYISIINVFSYFQFSGNKFIENSWPLSASFMNKILNELENIMWTLKSRLCFKN